MENIEAEHNGLICENTTELTFKPLIMTRKPKITDHPYSDDRKDHLARHQLQPS